MLLCRVELSGRLSVFSKLVFKLFSKLVFKRVSTIHHKDILLYFSGKSGGNGLDITVSLQVPGGRLQPFRGSRTSSDRGFLTKWHKVAVRVQDTQSMLRIFVDDEMVNVHSFKQQIVAYPRDAQLRLAQIFEVYLENTGVITSRFKVS